MATLGTANNIRSGGINNHIYSSSLAA